jgi:hypothetical protein
MNSMDGVDSVGSGGIARARLAPHLGQIAYLQLRLRRQLAQQLAL